MNVDELRAEIARLGPWHHDVELAAGIRTCESADQAVLVAGVPRAISMNHVEGILNAVYPDGLGGRSVLDCACNAGGYLFTATRLGAGRCFGFDVRDHWVRQARFLAANLPSENIEFANCDLMDLPKLGLEPFDVTLFMGIFYHLPDPIAGLRIAADHTAELLIVNTAMLPPGHGDALVFNPESRTALMSGVHGPAWLPGSERVLRELLRWCGFPHARVVFDWPVGKWRRIEILAAREERTFARYDARPKPNQERAGMLRSAYRKLPQRFRRGIRTVIRELPVRTADALPDLRDTLRSSGALPPARLRAAVGIDSSRSHYLTVGGAVAEQIASFAKPEGRWLDFGCGSGRIARHIAAHRAIALTGVDVDRNAVTWCAKNLRGDFRVVTPEPPLPFDAASFDVVYAVSIFTHLDEEPQLRWLAELRRVLRDGGALIASTHPPALTYNRSDLTEADHQRLNASGFLFARGASGFNDDSAFHHPDYIQRVWGRVFRSVDYRPGALLGYQDVTICIA